MEKTIWELGTVLVSLALLGLRSDLLSQVFT